MGLGSFNRRTLLGGAAAVGAGAAAAGEPAVAAAPRTREYWIAATTKNWDMVPNGRNAIEGGTFTRGQRMLDAIVYRAYTRRWERPLKHAPHLGLTGPVIHARAGDRILVHFLNLDTDREHSMHFHGVHYEEGSDGAYIPGFSGRGARVKPGETFTYRLRAGADSVGVWPYHDHSTSMHESITSGLYGTLSILGRHEQAPDREHVVFFSTHGEFMTINGRAFVGNTPVFHARVGEVVQWDVLTLGDEFHTFHVHGHRWIAADGTPADTRTIGPAESFRVRWLEDAPGAWLYHCHVESHMMAGMIGLYHVRR